MKSRTLPCNVENWRSDYQRYRASFHPAVGAALAAGSLKYRLSQFLRRAKTDLSCLDGDIQEQLDTFKVVVSDDIDRTARGQEGQNLTVLFQIILAGVLNVRDDDIHQAVLDTYDAIETVKAERKRDWNTVLMLRWAILLSKLGGLTLVTWGRNIGDWPSDVDLLNDVTTSYYMGISGRAVFSILWLLDDFRSSSCKKSVILISISCFRDMQQYEKPSCGSDDLHEVVSRQEFSPLLAGAGLAGVEKELLLIKFSAQLKGSVSCLTAVPSQFYDLDILGTKKAAKTLGDRLEDIIDAIKS